MFYVELLIIRNIGGTNIEIFIPLFYRETYDLGVKEKFYGNISNVPKLYLFY